jgi:hypothetical protein
LGDVRPDRAVVHLAAIAEDGGKALTLVLDAGDWAKVEEVLSAVLELNDKPEEGAAEP